MNPVHRWQIRIKTTRNDGVLRSFSLVLNAPKDDPLSIVLERALYKCLGDESEENVIQMSGQLIEII